MNYTLERLTVDHRKSVIDIYNHFVRNSFAAYMESPVGYDFFDRVMAMADGYPALAAKTESDDVVGFAFLHPFRPIPAFRRTAEITYFIIPEHTNKGLGSAILDRFIEEALNLGIDSLLANISSRNAQSLEFHRARGFVECGRFVEVGEKFGERFDMVWMQKRIGPARETVA
jgi:phosphinothricin acetyltransferase